MLAAVSHSHLPLLYKQDKRKLAMAKAAMKLEDTLSAHPAEAYPADLDCRLLHFRVLAARKRFNLALCFMILLTLLETPTWCSTDTNFLKYVSPHERCQIDGVSPSDILLSNLPYIPPGWAVILELVLVSTIARKLLLERSMQIKYFKPLNVVYYSVPWTMFGLVMCAFEVVDAIYFTMHRQHFRLAFLARTGYLCLLPAVQRLAGCIGHVISEFLSIAVFYLATVLFFAWIAVDIFKAVEGDVNESAINKGFEGFGSTINTMFVAGSTEEFVDNFLNTYTAYRSSGILWLVFLVTVQVLLLSLVLDTLVAAYTKYQENREEMESTEAIDAIKDVFHTITEAANEGEVMSRSTYMEFAQEFTRSSNMAHIPPHTAEIIFHGIDTDGTGTIDEEEFLSLCGVVQFSFWTTPEDSALKNMAPWLWNTNQFQDFRSWVRAGSLDTVMNAILMLNLVMVVIESVEDLNNIPEGSFMQNLELVFSMVYVVEIALKLCVWDFHCYWSLHSNQFDFMTTWALLGSSVLDMVASSGTNSSLSTYMNMLRLLRLLRILKQLKRLRKVQLMVETIATIVSASKDMMTLLGVVLFFFASASVQLWGGILYNTNPRMDETEYKEHNRFVLNFNDFGMSCGVWVVSLLCEYVAIFPDVIAKTSDIPGSWLLFLVFYICAVCIVFELVKAFTIEAFIAQHEKWNKPDEEFPPLQAIVDEFKTQGLILHYRVDGDASVHEKIMEALEMNHEAHEGEEGHGEHGEASHEEADNKHNEAELALLPPESRAAVRIAQAAWLLEDSLHNRTVKAYPVDLKARALFKKAEAAIKWANKAMFMMLLLTFFETPAWCNTTDKFWEHMEPLERCRIPGVHRDEILLSNATYLPPGVAVVIEFVLIAVIASKFFLQRRLQVKYFQPMGVQYYNKTHANFGLLMCFLEACEALYFVNFRGDFRLHFLARTGYLCLLPAVQGMVSCIRHVISEFVSIATFYVSTVVLFAWIAVVMFDDMKGEVNGSPINKGFETFGACVNTMFVSGSTEEFVDNFLNTYTAHRGSGILWFVFLASVKVLLLSLVLDTLVAAYRNYTEMCEEEESGEAIDGVKESYKILCHDQDGLFKDQFLSFMQEFQTAPRIPSLPRERADAIFDGMDLNKDGKIVETEFLGIASLVHNQVWTTQEDSPVKRCLPKLWNSASFSDFRSAVHSGTFDTFMNCVLMVNLVLVVIESVYDLNGWEESKVMGNLELTFSLVYVGEVLLKMCVWDFHFYWALHSNKFDFMTTWALLASSILDILASGSGGASLKKYMNVLRLLRLLRVLKQLKRLKKVQLMVETVSAIVSASKDMMVTLGVVTFFFTCLGVQLWGGILYESNPRLDETEYKENHRFVLNFNDFGTSLGVWVVSLLCEYVAIFPDVISKTSDIAGSWLIFLLFYIGAVCIVFELVKAFTIEAFLELHKRWDEPEEDFDPLKNIEEECQKRGEVLHFRQTGMLAVHEKLVEALAEAKEESHEQVLANQGEKGHLRLCERDESPCTIA